MGLRLHEGIDVTVYEAQAPRSLDRTAIAQLEQAGLIVFAENRLSATPRGRLVLNGVIAALTN
jgi:oxygen-independent coproporphyrinogen-3 oxidase